MKISKNILMITGIVVLTSVTTLLVSNLLRNNKNKAADTKKWVSWSKEKWNGYYKRRN